MKAFKKYQKRILNQHKRFIKKAGITKDVYEKRGLELDFIRFTEEIGEVARGISHFRTKRAKFKKADFGGELADIFFHICVLASSVGIDLEKAIGRKLKKNENQLFRHPQNR